MVAIPDDSWIVWIISCSEDEKRINRWFGIVCVVYDKQVSYVTYSVVLMKVIIIFPSPVLNALRRIGYGKETIESMPPLRQFLQL